MTAREVADFVRCIEGGGLALFPADTVYGLAADPDSRQAVERLYALKGRSPDVPAAVMSFGGVPEMPWLGPRTRAALENLLPGPVTVLVPNPEHRHPLACGPEPGRLGVRVPDLVGPARPLAGARVTVLQSSANLHGGADARRLADVDPRIRAGVDVELDGGELPGTPSTVVDLTAFEGAGAYEVLRAGALPPEALRRLLEVAVP